MRPIKFRARRTDNHPVFWAYGCLVKTPITAEFNDVYGAFFDSSPHPTKKEWGGRWCIVTNSGVAHEIDIETVGQFTGLLDKNGKGIYEGDIVHQYWDPFKKGDNQIGEVTIESTRGVCVGSKPIWIHECEVIGNIYENPNLLGKEGEWKYYFQN